MKIQWSALIAGAAMLLFSGHSFAQSAACDPISTAIATTPSPPFVVGNYQAAIELLAKKPENADVLLIGDSLLANWRPTLAKAFPGVKVVNFSVGGDRTQQILWRMKEATLAQQAPKAIVVLAGTNNLADKGTLGCAVFEGLKAIVSGVKATWPTAPVFVVSVTPRGADFHDFDAERKILNSLIATFPSFAQGVFPVMIDDNDITCGQYALPTLPAGTLACFPEKAYRCNYYQSDNLHFSNDAYPFVRQTLGEVSTKELGKDVFSK